ncbi:MAG TPA: lysine--tRNA ligase [Candidatus Paceibacterota bacterium]|nr:lysine--tRNA ligase [Candidatus Paceibacterota bacterium]
MSSGDALRDERLKKLELLRDAGMDPYPVESARDTSNADFLDAFDEGSSAHVTIAGRIMSRRGQGGIIFADCNDGTAKVQLVLQESEMEAAEFALFSDTVDVGDFVEARGTAYTTKRGEKSLLVHQWKMLAKALSPIPDQWFGLKDEEKILRERYLDILLNPEVRAMFERRAKFWHSIRAFLLERGFYEAETPVLEVSPGGADARPFQTHHNALDIDLYLRISLELWLKRLLVAGFPKVFEIGRIFRNEGQSREHLQDYTQLETYEAYSDMQTGMQFVQDLYRHIAREVYGKDVFEIGKHTVNFADDWPTIDFSEELQKNFGIDPATCTEAEAIDAARGARVLADADDNKSRAVDQLWKMVRKDISGPAFLVGVPVYLEPLAKRTPGNPNTVERFQVILAGSEMGKGFSELNDPLDQRDRFEEQQKLRDRGDEEAQRLDEDYVRAMEYGMPPAFGFGVSERLFAFLENRPAHEAQLFPLLRPKTD